MKKHFVHAALFLAAFLGSGIVTAIASSARADDCNADIANFNKKRQAVIDSLNQLAKGGKKQLDPIASCPKLKNLVVIEHQLIAYLNKNKDWCNVPDEALTNITTSSTKSESVATQACAVAAQAKKMQQQQAAGGVNAPQAQKLPTGPL
jgi:hypothetical protein